MSAFLGMSLLGAAFISSTTTEAIHRHNYNESGNTSCPHCCRHVSAVCTKVLTPVTVACQKVVIKYVVAASSRCISVVKVKLRTPSSPEVIETTLSAVAVEPPYTRLILELGPANCLNALGTYVAEIGLVPVCQEDDEHAKVLAPSTFTFEKNNCVLVMSSGHLGHGRLEDTCDVHCTINNRADYVCKVTGFQVCATRHHDGRCVTKNVLGPFDFLPGTSEIKDLCLCRYDLRQILSDNCGGKYDICIFIIDAGGRVLASCWCDDELWCESH